MQATERRSGRGVTLPNTRPSPQWIGAAARVVGVSTALTVVATTAIAQRYRFLLPENGLGPTVVRAENWPGPHSRVMVIAPHPDDEALGGEMVLRLCATRRIPAAVVVITCGDGFVKAAATATHRRATPADMIAFGKLRQSESVRAIRAIGLSAAQVTFLGFPDGGLARLWSTNWNLRHPFVSRTTRVDHCPYSRVLRPGAPYSGQALLNELQQSIAAFRPTDIYVSHPWDYHPDHAAANYFVMAALHSLQDEPFARAVRIHPYLVHCGSGFPMPRGYWPMYYVDPPTELRNNGLTWSELRLTPGQAAYRLRIIDMYASQVALTRPFLESFARRNVLFGDTPPFQGRVAHWMTPVAAHWSPRDQFYLRPQTTTRNAVIRQSLIWTPQGLLIRVQSTVPTRQTLCRVVAHPLIIESARQSNGRGSAKPRGRVGTWPEQVTAYDSGRTSYSGAMRVDVGNSITLLLPRKLFHGADRAYLDITLIHRGHLVRSAPTRELVVPPSTYQ